MTGRISALAFDPSDATGNSLYLGATGGGVWFSQNAGSADSSSVEFIPLTDAVAALSGATDVSISIGALTVQPGGTGVILAGTGDPNDALDSYYGAGILRSADGGNTWSLIDATVPSSAGQQYTFAGEGFAGFAWSTVNPELVVAAVSQAFEGVLVNAEIPSLSYEGLYYSADSGVTWNLATITDGNGADVQGPNDVLAQPDGNAATSVVWNPVRKLFVAAVRFHGYYQSANGIVWTRMADQPGSGLTTQMCPTNSGSTGSIDCPIFRGTLAVNPQTGDTFAWSVDVNKQDQGLWQDKCSIRNSACATGSVTFATQWNTTALEANTSLGAATIANGDYNLALAAVPSGQDTLLMAGDNDLWKCSLAAGCAWRNTTNAFTCASASVGGYQHVVAWSTADPLEILAGNDSGLWRSTDAIAETGPACSSSDATHFQNLNGGLGSLAEVASVSAAANNPNTLMAGLGANGTAGVKTTGIVSDWPQVLGGEGGPVAIDYDNNSNWYANNQPGVSIHLCAQSAPCNPAAFGADPVVNNADVDGDGLTMTTPAPFLVDPVDHTQLLIGTCRVWRGPANGNGWTTGNAVSPILDGDASNVSCNGDPLIRSMAALQISSGSEMIYAGMYGPLDGGAALAGHIFGAVVTAGSNSNPAWQDLTLNPVVNDTVGMNAYGYDISSIFIDPHDSTGNTVYVTVEGFETEAEQVRAIYSSTDGGAHWANLTSNLPQTPASGVVVDPQDASTVYLATDAGVFSTRQISTCVTAATSCWTAFGTGLPEAPAVELLAAPVSSAAHVLSAATYGRGIWQIPLWTADTQLTTATVKPASLKFANQASNSTSNAQTVTLNNTGSVALTVALAISGDFTGTDNCQGGAIAAGTSCAIQIRFAPTQTGLLTGLLTIGANVSGGQLTVPLSGSGVSAGTMTLIPPTVSFGQVEVGTVSGPLPVTANNSGGSAVSISNVAVTGAFQISANTCGTSLAADTACQITLDFAPTQAGAASGKLTMTDGAGTQSVQLSGTGAAAPTDALSPASLTLAATVIGQLSAAQTVVLTNSGDLPLTAIGSSIGGNFQVSDNCGTTLPGHSSCAFSVVFAPAQLGVQTGVLTVTDALRSQTVNLAGTGLAPPAFTITPSKLSFAPQEVGVASAAQSLTVMNSGGAPMANVGFQAVGQSAASFAVSSTTCGARLNNGSSCTAQVVFKPEATGGNAATLVVSSSTIGVAAGIVMLSGTGLAPPQLSVRPVSLLFGSVLVGSSSTAQAVTISNTGGVALNDMHLAISGDYSFVAGSCSAVLAAGASCTTNVTFAPTATGARTGVFTISSVSGAATPATVSLTGTGTAPANIQASSAELDFGSLLAGRVSGGKTLTISDVGTAALSGLTLELTGPFQLTQNQCGSSLSANASCKTQVVFAPIAVGTQTGTLTITSTTKYVSPVVVALTGDGLAAPVLEVSPRQLTFGGVLMGSTSTALSVAIGDPGGAAVAGLSLKATGDFALLDNTCGTTLATGATCFTQVTFSPTASGNRTGMLTISGASPDLQPVEVPLSGTGQAQGSLSGTPSNLSFGTITVGQSSAAQTATLENSGVLAASGLKPKIAGDYTIQSTTCGAALGSGVSCAMQIVFSPSTAGDRGGTLTATSTTQGVGPALIVLDGMGVAPGYVTASPPAVAFPGTPVGAASSPMTVTLSDPGIASAAGLQAQTTGDFSAKICATNLASGASCNMSVVFNPTGAGVRTGQLTITTTAAGASPAIVSLSGAGTVPAGISLNPSSLSFPGTAIDQTSVPQTIVVANSGASQLNTPVLAVTGDFQISANTCSGALAPSASCNVQIDFAPAAAGGRTGTLTVSSTTPLVQPVTANLSGTGIAPAAIGVAPLSLNFGGVLVGQASTAQMVTITNTGGAAMASLSLSVSPQFLLSANTCSGALAAGASCTASIVFQPVEQGAIAGGLTVASPSVGTMASVALSGTGGVPASIAVLPGVVNFPTTGVGQTSSPATVTVSNPGTATALSGLTLTIGSGFQLVKNACPPTLEPMKSCTTGIVFAPSITGSDQAALTVSATGVTAGTVTLMGRGFDFTVKPNGATSLTVSNGQTASYNLKIAPMGGADGTFTFACGSLPANTACVFSPAQETVNAGATGFVIVNIETGQGAPTASVREARGWRVLPLGLGLILLPLALRKRRRGLMLVAMLAITTAGITSCLTASGGGKTGLQNPGGPGTTPPATYSIPVTVTADGVAHSITLTLTVD